MRMNGKTWHDRIKRFNMYCLLFCFSLQFFMSADDSSDEELIYGIDDDGADNFGFGMSFDEKYAKYKKRVQNELAGEVVSSASDSD